MEADTVIPTHNPKQAFAAPNKTAKSYIELNDKIKAMNGVKFVWITDGNGWTRSRLNLEDAYDNIEHLYTIKDLEDGLLNRL